MSMKDHLTSFGGEAGIDEADALGLPFFLRKKPVPSTYLSSHPDSEEYNMKHPKRGKCLIFNNKDFEPHTNLKERKGNHRDVEQLYCCFRELDFEVVIHCNLSVKKIKIELEKVSKENHSESDCFICCVLTHGDRGVLYGRDGRFPTEVMFSPFTGDMCTTLAGKPKMFFIQACQGDKLDRGVTLLLGKDEADAATQFFKIPTHADFLISYSTVPGFCSFRNTNNGSWFIQALCNVLKTQAKDSDLQSLMTVVCRKVAYDFESCKPDDPKMSRMKQMPCISSTLTRKIFFHPKF
ncbi:caspase-like [Limulus polyphemus]|uniref:Caspase-like n=1 Tax=Limulus polyphemus TaxID=6850 RepID=A0ABM1S8N1_LIMPO|nr:caspase-like [Limulus polyphemus]XP_022239986.1 caspase-like [Limulus polyphemus]XP_022239987.1 caspase-like [Limulus polyphemus]